MDYRWRCRPRSYVRRGRGSFQDAANIPMNIGIITDGRTDADADDGGGNFPFSLAPHAANDREGGRGKREEGRARDGGREARSQR